MCELAYYLYISNDKDNTLKVCEYANIDILPKISYNVLDFILWIWGLEAYIYGEYGRIDDKKYRISQMERLFLKKPKYAESNSSVLLVLENNILNRSIRTVDRIKGKISEEVFDKLSQDEKTIIHFMYNSRQKITTKMATELIEKGSTFCRKLLKNLADKDLLEWHGTSQNDRIQYYTLKF